MPMKPEGHADGEFPRHRREDLRLVTGRGQYAVDLDLPRTARAVMVRSPHAHAPIRGMDFAAARALPGVLAVLSGGDALADGLQAIPHATGSSKIGSDMPLAHCDGSERLVTKQRPLPIERARFVGVAVAMVVAETLAQARDAAEAVVIDWEPLPAVAHAIDALEDDAPQLWDHVPGNRTLEAHLGDAAATEAAFARAAHRVRLTSWVQRVTGVHMEPRAVIAAWDETAETYTVHASHGIGVVQMRDELAVVLGVAKERVRVIAPLPNLPPVMLLALVAGAGFCILGLQFGNIATEGNIYPTYIRAWEMGSNFAVGRIGGALGPLLGGFAFAAKMPAQQIFLIATLPLVIGLIATLAIVPLYRRHLRILRADQESGTAVIAPRAA